MFVMNRLIHLLFCCCLLFVTGCAVHKHHPRDTAEVGNGTAPTMERESDLDTGDSAEMAGAGDAASVRGNAVPDESTFERMRAEITAYMNSLPAATATFEGGTSEVTIPFRMIDDHVVVTVTVNENLDIDMVLDTGMGIPGAILLDPVFGEKLGLEYVGKTQLGGGGEEDVRVAGVAAGATFSLPGISFSDQQLLVVEDRTGLDDWPIMGVIGRTIFGCVVSIDYETETLVLTDPAAFDPEGYGEPFDVEFVVGLPVVTGKVEMDDGNSVPARFVVDTGADELLLFPYSDHRLAAPAETLRGVHGILAEGMSGEVRGVTGRIGSLTLGPFSLDDPIACFTEKESMGPALIIGQNGYIGGKILERFTATFDYKGSKLYLKPNSRFEAPFETNMAGLIMNIGIDHVLHVLDTVSGSPADEAGIQRGDKILALNGNGVDNLDIADIVASFFKDGEQLRLTFERKGVSMERTVLLRRLI